MISLSLKQIASAVNGTLVGQDQLVTGSVETDSRLVKAGSLFIAKPGEITDGHLFVTKAAENGAVAAIVERQVADSTIAQIVVTDSVAALGLLAKFVLSTIRASHPLTVIGITGSNGKTSTKNMLREILSRAGETIAPIESYNNEVGAPISMLKASETTKYLVVELGAGGVGSIDYLTKICQPDIGVVLKVGLAHVGEFGGIETTLQIKSELAIGLTKEDRLVLNADDGLVASMQDLSAAEVHWFGTSENSGVWASDIAVTLSGTKFVLHIGANNFDVQLNILGEHQVMNALAAIEVSLLLGLPIEETIAALELMPLAERWRMQLLKGPNGSHVINDAYNASPDSTKAALQTLATLGRQGHRTIAVLGEMAELGSAAAEQHDAIGRIAVRLNIDQVVVVGERAKLIHMGASQEGSWDGESKFFESIDEALEAVRGLLGFGDIVLVKSSKSAELRHLGDALAEVNA
ncbi:MAG: UDP-N-acetylmuramoyl-tripeptide--D-alanyl-D-alanine ligase [Rhodoluna sp.]|nr:UDP-N-acetylmuramoyl-tripeptide--D-alanyl-D-alanine ligase [Rhodoluna sp.]MBP6186440.1 UDP-N-acetylmuramoyl-tripeptide--D-alanyl-D-alanine ligase [Rhodoluna sp.]